MANLESNYDHGKPKRRYEELKPERDPYLTRAKDYAKVTIPYVMPETADQASTEVTLDYNSIGAGLCSSLANRYVEELFPVHKSFFKLQIDETERTEEMEDDTDIDTLLVAGERRAKWAFEQRHARPTLLDLMKHNIISGNGLIYYPPTAGKLQMYALDEYVLMRDAAGNVTEIITDDTKGLLSLEVELRKKVMADLDLTEDQDLAKEKVHLYTYIRLDPEDPTTYLVNQSLEGIEVEDSFQSYTAELLPWLPQVWNRTRREIYGRGLVEDHYPSFWSLSILSEALVTGAATMSDIKYLVRPGSMLDVNSMNKAASGTYHYGNPDDVNAIQTNKQADYSFIKAVIDDYRQHLGKAFLSISSQMRDAERVTAEENRIRAMELDQAHGGTFSNYGSTLQSPVATLLLRDIDLTIEGSSIEPVIVTGLDAMSRNANNEKVRLWMDDMSILNSLPEDVRARLKIDNLANMLANGRDVDSTQIVMTEEEFVASQKMAQEQQAQAMAGQEMLKKADAGQIAEGLQQGA